MSRAEYMRKYRASKKTALPIVEPTVDQTGWMQWDCPACGQRVSSVMIPGEDGRAKIIELEAEVKHLKAQLAQRSKADGPLYAGLTSPPGTRNLATETRDFNLDRWTPEFRPAPKVKPHR